MTRRRALQVTAELEKLREENARLKEEVAKEFNAKRYKSNKTPPDDSGSTQGASSPTKKRGGKFGHSGWFRKKPKKIDPVEDVRLAARLRVFCLRRKKFPFLAALSPP